MQINKAYIAFHFKWPIKIIEKLSVNEFQIWREALDIVLARENMVKLDISDYPHLKLHSRKRIYEKFDKIAYPKDAEVKNWLSVEEVAKALRAKGF